MTMQFNGRITGKWNLASTTKRELIKKTINANNWTHVEHSDKMLAKATQTQET